MVTLLSLSTQNTAAKRTSERPIYIEGFAEIVQLLKLSVTPNLRYIKIRFAMDGIKKDYIPDFFVELERASEYLEERNKHTYPVTVHISASYDLLYSLHRAHKPLEEYLFWDSIRYLHVNAGKSTGTLDFYHFHMNSLREVWITQGIEQAAQAQHTISPVTGYNVEGNPKVLRIDQGVDKRVELTNVFFPEIIHTDVINARKLCENNPTRCYENVKGLFLRGDGLLLYGRDVINFPNLRYLAVSAVVTGNPLSHEGLAEFLTRNGGLVEKLHIETNFSIEIEKIVDSVSALTNLKELHVYGPAQLEPTWIDDRYVEDRKGKYFDIIEQLSRHKDLLSRLSLLRISYKNWELNLDALVQLSKTCLSISHFPKLKISFAGYADPGDNFHERLKQDFGIKDSKWDYICESLLSTETLILSSYDVFRSCNISEWTCISVEYNFTELIEYEIALEHISTVNSLQIENLKVTD